MPPSTKRAIEKARKNGHICVINTGRTWKMVNGIITNDTVFDGYVLGCGTMVTYRDRVLFHKIFARELACRIVESLRRNEIDAVLEGRENNFCDGPERIHTPLFHDFIADLQKNDYGTFENAPGHFDKLFAYTENTAGMDAFIEEFSAELDFVDREGGFYEIMPKGISKASGMRFLAQHLQIPMCDTVAIGDSSNDIPMLECANISIAMGNGSEEVLKMADYVTGRADQDGIERALGWLGVI
nr:HAD family hydrolase [uncultured Acetatifactor sp.]